jgi:hypothetical protein
MNWFSNRNLVTKEATKDLEGQVAGLVKDKRELKEELEELKLKKRLEQEEIAHLQKINEERLKSDLDRKELKLEQDFQKKINAVEEESMKKVVDSLSQFHTKMEEKFDSELSNMKDVLALLMKGLPNVNMEITKHIGEPRLTDKSKDK